MSKTKIFWSAALAIVLVLCVGLNGAGMAEAQSASAVQIAMSAGELTGRIISVLIFPLYCATLILPVTDIFFWILNPICARLLPFLEVINWILYGINLILAPLSDSQPTPPGTTTTVTPEVIAGVMGDFATAFCGGATLSIWNLLVIYTFFTCNASTFLFDLIPAIGLLYEGCTQSNLQILAAMLVEG